jgi:hypothetical protein
MSRLPAKLIFVGDKAFRGEERFLLCCSQARARALEHEADRIGCRAQCVSFEVQESAIDGPSIEISGHTIGHVSENAKELQVWPDALIDSQLVDKTARGFGRQSV